MSISKLIKQTLKTTILLTSIAFFSVFLSQPTYATSITAGDLNNLANAERIGAGLSPLSLNAQLNGAALNKANHMFANDYWAHIAPDGMTPWNFIDASGYVYLTAGENLALHYTTSDGVIKGWMASPTHQANVLHSSYTDVGYAVVNGVLLGNDTTLIVAMYGSQKTAPVIVESIASPSNLVQVEVAAQPEVIADSELIEVSDVVKTNVEVGLVDDEKTNGVNVNVQVAESSDRPLIESKSSQPGAVAGIMSIIPESISVYKSLELEHKIAILISCLLALMISIKLVLFNLYDKNGNKYVWFRKRPIAGSTILGFVFLINMINSIWFVL